MSLPREDYPKHIADRLNELAAKVKTRSRASLTDANHILETIAKRFFNALCGWDLENLNALQANYPAADLGDRRRRIAIQVTNEGGSDKISHTVAKAIEHDLSKDFDRLIICFLLPRKPGFPKKFVQLPKGPEIETWDIADLLRQMLEVEDLQALARAAKVLDEEMGRICDGGEARKFDISRILKYAPAELIGREEEMKLLDDAWAKTQNHDPKRPRVLTFFALGGEGKTALVAKWAVDHMLAQDWPGCDAAFAWSFYSQGAGEKVAADSDLFLKEALNFFGDDADKAFAAGNAGAFEKGQRLARLVGQRCSLLILDGLEPLQYAPTSPTPGQLKDQGLTALLKGLAQNSQGLCVVTTRYSLPDLKAFWQTTAPEVKLLRLSRGAGVHLLKTLGVKGSELRNIPLKEGDEKSEKVNEFEKLVEDVKGHALTLTLLGSYLRDAHGGDIRKRDLVKLEEADAEEQAGHAFRVMEAYERAFEREGDKGLRALAILRLLGLFDRPMTADCFAALLKAPAISGLTDPLVGLSEAQRNIAIKRLEDAKLVTVNRDPVQVHTSSFNLPTSLDAHPLLREYFAKQFRDLNPDAWRASHRRLYEHLCKHKEGDQPTLDDLQPLYQAVYHGCQAQRFEEALIVYRSRLSRDEQRLSTYHLGAWGSDLAALSGFFESPWTKTFKELGSASPPLLNMAGFILWALGRLREARAPMVVALEAELEGGFWQGASGVAGNLSQISLALGETRKAIEYGRKCVEVARVSESPLQIQTSLCTLADALHQSGDLSGAARLFREAETNHQTPLNGSGYLSSYAGFWFCDLLLSQGHFQQVRDRARRTCELFSDHLSVGLDHLSWGRAVLLQALNSDMLKCSTGRSEMLEDAARHLQEAVERLRASCSQPEIVQGLLGQAMFHRASSSWEKAWHYLEEAHEIAERSELGLAQADFNLEAARLSWAEAKKDQAMKYLALTEKMTSEMGYGRRKAELERLRRQIGIE